MEMMEEFVPTVDAQKSTSPRSATVPGFFSCPLTLSCRHILLDGSIPRGGFRGRRHPRGLGPLANCPARNSDKRGASHRPRRHHCVDAGCRDPFPSMECPPCCRRRGSERAVPLGKIGQKENDHGFPLRGSPPVDFQSDFVHPFSPASRGGKRQATFKPTLEQLENRLTPSANLLNNGDFEMPETANGLPVHSSINPTAITSWRVSSGSVDLTNQWQAASGQQSLDLNGNFDVPADGANATSPANGTIYQDVAISTPGTYLLSFAMAGNPNNAPLIASDGCPVWACRRRLCLW